MDVVVVVVVVKERVFVYNSKSYMVYQMAPFSVTFNCMMFNVHLNC